MAEVGFHSQSFTRWITRWRSERQRGGRLTVGEVTSWVQPVAQVDRDWRDDDVTIWGYHADVIGGAAPNIWPAAAIFALDRDVFVRRIDYHTKFGPTQTLLGKEVHLFRPPDGYNPCIINPGEFFPFLQTSVGDNIQLPRCRCIVGLQTGLMVVTVGGVPVNPALGPRYTQRTDILSGGGATFGSTQTILDWSDPPLRIAPFNVLALQIVNPGAGGGDELLANFYVSEREAPP